MSRISVHCGVVFTGGLVVASLLVAISEFQIVKNSVVESLLRAISEFQLSEILSDIYIMSTTKAYFIRLFNDSSPEQIRH